MKCFIVLDSDYWVRENIGFIRCECECDVKEKVLELIKSNYEIGEVEAQDYYNDNIVLTEVSLNLNDDELTNEYADGLNWIGDLNNTHLVTELKEGKEKRDKLIEKLKSKDLSIENTY